MEQPSTLVGELRASLRATDAYLRVLTERLELACATDPTQLTALHADFLIHVIAASDAFGNAAMHTLRHIEPRLAHRAEAIADLARDAPAPSDPTGR